ncbi:MAG: protein kinase [Planctomycetes bacterium]|nr:protein kinase [Planctomycetota bacterium]
MKAGPQPRYSEAARQRFADLIARHDAGEPVDFEREVATPPELASELRLLHAGWLLLGPVLQGVRAGESELREAEEQAGGRPLQLDARTRRLLDLLGRLRGSEARYERLDEIARGGMGVVLRVREKGVERELALKRMFRPEELPPSLRGLRAQLLRRLLDEAWILSRLQHPGIVQLHELGVDEEGLVYFTMPLVRGRTLAEAFELVRAGREGWTVARALGFLQRVCEALAFAHSIGIVHRDLKPANVMVGRFGELQVMDWGLARSREIPRAVETEAERDAAAAELERDAALTLGGDVLGTPAYMAPEQAFGRSADASPRADVYALGAMLYELLTGVRPYHSEHSGLTSGAMLERVKAGPPVPIEELALAQPPELLAICRKAMQRDPEQRYANMEQLGEDLRAHLERRVVGAYETGAWAQARKWVLRNRALAASLAAVLLVLVAGLVVSLVFKSRADVKAAEAATRKRFGEQLSAFRTLEEFGEQAESLWPPGPENVAAYRDWLERAAALEARLPEFEASLGTAEVHETPGWQDELTKVIAEMKAFANEQTGLMRGVVPGHGWGIAKRLDFASRVEERTVSGTEVRALWDDAIAGIAASPRYDGLKLNPQLGLLPLGPDPKSGLWEFAHLLTGEPARRQADGTLAFDEQTGVVLVLIPGGSFFMGSQLTRSRGQNYYKDHIREESPLHKVTLSPYFIAKYEFTQGQWLRATGKTRARTLPTTIPSSRR